ncbi:MAG: hypothetical protein RJA13_2332 [Bacteroidota bacterium]
MDQITLFYKFTTNGNVRFHICSLVQKNRTQMALHLLDIQPKRRFKELEIQTKRTGEISAKRLVSYLT